MATLFEELNVSREELTAFYRCGRKLAYETVELARQSAERVFAENGIQLLAYACPYGEHFHMGKEHTRLTTETSQRDLTRSWLRNLEKAEAWRATRQVC